MKARRWMHLLLVGTGSNSENGHGKKPAPRSARAADFRCHERCRGRRGDRGVLGFGASRRWRRCCAPGASILIAPSSARRPSRRLGNADAGERCRPDWRKAGPIVDVAGAGRVLHPRAGRRARQHHLSRDVSWSAVSTSRISASRFQRAGRQGYGQARHGRAARRRAGLDPPGRACWRCAGTARPARR